MANIDSLSIQISASASEANKAIGTLTSNLSTLSNQLGKLNVGSLSSFANGIKTLSDGVKNLQDIKGRDISSIANGIKKFQDIDAGKIISVGTSLTTLASALSTISAVTFNAESINGIITSLSKLGTVKSTAGVDNLLRIKDTLAQFVMGMNTIEGVTFDTTNLTNLIMTISKLGNVSANNATKNLPSISAQLQNFVRQMNTIGSMTFDTTNLASLVTAISKLGRNTVTNAITNLPQLTTQLNSLITTLSKAPTVSSNTIQMTNALANLASQGNKVGSASRSLNSGLTSTRRSMNHTTRSARGLASAIGMFYARFFLLIRAIRKLGSAIKASMDYVENLNYFNKAFSQVASKADLSSWKELGYKSAEAYGQALQKELSRQALETTTKMSGYSVSENGMVVSARTKSLGINPTQVMKYQAMYAQMASSMGVASDTAAKMSRALTEIGADLASVRNMDFDKVWTDMASGLAGMSRTLDKYGANIRNVNLQQKLNELGIQANISALNQNDKALLRTIILLENTKYAWGDNAQTLNSGANQLRMLKSNFANLSRTIGNIFLPTVAAILPYINGLVIALQRLAERIVKLLGNTDFNWGGTGGADETSLSYLYDDADQLSDNLDDATSSAKKLKNELMGFDEINKLSDNTDDTSNTSTGGLDEAGRGLLNSAFDKVLSDYQTVWDKAFDDMGNKANEIADRIESAFKSKNFRNIGLYISTSLRDALDSINWESVYKRVEGFASGLAEFLNGLIRPDTFYTVGKTIANSLNTSLHSLLTFGETFDWANFGDSLAEGINGFFGNFDFERFGKTINTWVHGLAEAFLHFINGLDIKQIFKGLWDALSELDLGTITIIVSAFALRNIATTALMMLSGSISGQVGGYFALNPIIISTTVMLGSILLAKNRLDPIFDDYTINQIKDASREMFTDWFGDNAFSKTASDSFVTLATAISKPKEVLDAFKQSVKDMENYDFEFNFLNLKTFGKNSAVSKTVSDIGVSLDALITKPKEVGKAFKLMWEDIKSGDFDLNLFHLNDYDDVNLDKLSIQESVKLIDQMIEKYPKLKSFFNSKDFNETGVLAANSMVKGFNIIKEKVPKSLKDTITSTIEKVIPKSNELGDKMSSAIGLGFNTIKNMLPEKVRASIDKIKSDNQSLIESTGSLFANRLNTGFDAIKNMISKTTKESLDKSQNDNINRALSVGEMLRDKLSNAFENLPLFNKVKSALDKIRNINSNDSYSIGEHLKDRFVNGFSSLSFTSNIKNALTNAYNNNYNTFNEYGVGLGKAIGSGISSGFQDKQSSIFSVISSFFEGLNIKTAGSTFGAGAGLQLGFETKAYAAGGFPEDGLFFANHNELVGQFSNGRTAVANNEQITTGIEEAAYRGMMRALSESQGNQNVTIQVEGDATGMFKVMQRQANDYMIRTGMVPFPS